MIFIEALGDEDVVLAVFEYCADGETWRGIGKDSDTTDGLSVSWDTSAVRDGPDSRGCKPT